MLTVTVAGIWARKRRLLGTCTAVVLGVAFLAATLVLGDSMRCGLQPRLHRGQRRYRRRRAQQHRHRLQRHQGP